MRLEQFDPGADAESVAACHEIYLAAAAVDDPVMPRMSRRSFRGWLAMGWTEDPAQTWLARDSAGTTIGWYLLGLPQRENTELAYLTLIVHPSRRRARCGTGLLGHAAARAGGQHRTVLSGAAPELSAGAAFARAVGARQGLTEVHRVLRPADLPVGRLAELRSQAQARASGYSVELWAGPVPAAELAAVAEVYGAVEDMPHDPGHEPQRWDAERVRRSDRRVETQGLRYYTVAARERATRELAALTQLGVDPDNSAWGLQELTAVARPHRGHRLGLLVKVAMLDWLAEREPQLTQILTGNSDTNDHMIAINAALGFEVFGRWLSFDVDVARVAKADSS